MVSEDATLCPALTRGPQTSFVTEGGGTGQLGSKRKYERGVRGGVEWGHCEDVSHETTSGVR